MHNKIIQLAIGTTSVGAIETVQRVDIPSTIEVESTIKLILQIIIAIASLVQLFKKKEPVTTKNKYYEN
jgi:hypothetical protein